MLNSTFSCYMDSFNSIRIVFFNAKIIVGQDKVMGFYAKRLNEFSVGRVMTSSFQWIVSIAILLKVYNIPKWAYPISIILLFFFVWGFGVIMVKTGLWDRYIKENLKGIKN